MFRRAGRVLALGLLVAVGAAVPAWAQRATERVSVRTGGGQGDDDSSSPALSADGRFVAFDSFASNLVPGDTNNTDDVFVHDRRTGTIRRASVSSGGTQGNADSGLPAVSADGRFVAFDSMASNLVPGDTNGKRDVFVRDREAGTTRRVSVSSGGTQGKSFSSDAALSADGRFVAFESLASNLAPGDTNNATDVFVHDRRTGTTRRVSVRTGGGQGNGHSFDAKLSADGRLVVFVSGATNLVPGDTNNMDDVFVHDLRTNATQRVSVSSGGSQGNDDSFCLPALSADGRFVAFESLASNLVPGDTNGFEDVFVHDRWTGTTRRVSVRTGGGQGNGHSFGAKLSADGRVVAFESFASNLVPGDTNERVDVFVHTR